MTDNQKVENTDRSDEVESKGQVDVSIVIPVYNEEAILHAAIVDLRDNLQGVDWSYEILISENGSKDTTVEIAKKLAERFDDVRVSSVGEPNYGLAMRQGIMQATGTFVVCDEIDLCDTSFHRRAIEILQQNQADLIVGSKLLDSSNDERPWARNAASRIYNGMLRVGLGFRGTDTHGLKAFRRDKLLPIVNRCVADKDVFASEFVIRAYREGVNVQEIPIRVVEKRRPSINLVRRVPNVMKQLARLAIAIRLN